MAGQSDIEWTDATWNPISGCLMVSPGCTNCYALRMAARLQSMEHPSYSSVVRKSGGRPVWTGKLHFNKAALEIPLGWRSPKRIFVNSMSDLFQSGVPPDFIRDVWATMEQAHWHSFQVLTKRPENMAAIVKGFRLPVLNNVWLGTSVESGSFADRISVLRTIPAAVRFVSFEPLIDRVPRPNLKNIHWAIVGGESGPKARPMRTEWASEIYEACERHGAAFFFKQWGGLNKKKTGRIFKGRTWDTYPTIAVEAAE